MTTKCSFLLLCVTFSLANSQDPNTGLFCISDCSTCPVICSPPPSPIKLKPPHSPSPSTSLLQTPPPPPPLFAPLRPSPPQSSSHSPSPPSSSSHKSPPPSYMIYTGAPPPPSHSSNCPTPPNPPNIIPVTQVPPAVVGQNYPYYYYFASEAASLPLHGCIFLGFWLEGKLYFEMLFCFTFPTSE
ncbi:hypothetical protein RND71_008284 [Anisodus tanguticus]|uniref:Uncharacterized protein n=1 Tax=Anisodus tanguticus TaxID=243964 RepID=A0AAE1SMY6_9SOLA|nr:hypothetical protein RND71_008284 [Anisodus tanguticus]